MVFLAREKTHTTNNKKNKTTPKQHQTRGDRHTTGTVQVRIVLDTAGASSRRRRKPMSLTMMLPLNMRHLPYHPTGSGSGGGRRNYSRRGSKTPAMLLAECYAITTSDLEYAVM